MWLSYRRGKGEEKGSFYEDLDGVIGFQYISFEGHLDFGGSLLLDVCDEVIGLFLRLQIFSEAFSEELVVEAFIAGALMT